MENNNYLFLNDLFDNINRRHKLFKIRLLDDIGYSVINKNNNILCNKFNNNSRVKSKESTLSINKKTDNNKTDILEEEKNYKLYSTTNNGTTHDNDNDLSNNNYNMYKNDLIVDKQQANNEMAELNIVNEFESNEKLNSNNLTNSKNLSSKDKEPTKLKIKESNSSVVNRKDSNWINSSTMKEKKDITYHMNIPEKLPKYVVKSNSKSEIRFINDECNFKYIINFYL